MVRLRANRSPQMSYQESGEEDNVADDQEWDAGEMSSSSPIPVHISENLLASTLPARTSRRNRSITDYADEISEPESFIDDSDDSDSKPKSHRKSQPMPDRLDIKRLPKRKRVSARNNRSLFQSDSAKNSRKRPRREPRFMASNSTKSALKVVLVDDYSNIESDGVIPPWATLPYHVVVSIFNFAWLQRLHDHPNSPVENTSWMLSLALVCKDFAEPALSVLYRNPLLGNNLGSFIHLMTNPSPSHFINYNTKVKKLRVDERNFGPGFDLCHLFSALPNLQHINIDSGKDREVRGLAHAMAELYKPYTETSLAVLKNMRLLSWNWNPCMVPLPRTDEDIRSLWCLARTMNPDEPFNGVVNLQLTNLFPVYLPFVPHNASLKCDEPNLKLPEAWKLLIDQNVLSYGSLCQRFLADSLSSMPNLVSLRLDFFSHCQPTWMQALPSTLKSLHIYCCEPVDSSSFSTYLVTNGHNLESVKLDHNPNLDLSFLSDLRTACPKLQTFYMDLRLFALSSSIMKVCPGFTEMLPENCKPTWPSSLADLNLTRLHSLNDKSAEILFRSLVDNVTLLQNLRSIYISGSVNVDFRERAKFRDKWTSLFKHVFLRQYPPPRPEFASAKTYRSWLEAQQTRSTAVSQRNSRSNGEDYTSSSSRIAGRLRSRHSTNYDQDGEEAIPNSPALSSLVSAVLGNGGAEKSQKYAPSCSSFPTPPAQGMCDFVYISIDNLRSTGQTFTERDFLDVDPREQGSDAYSDYEN